MLITECYCFISQAAGFLAGPFFNLSHRIPFRARFAALFHSEDPHQVFASDCRFPDLHVQRSRKMRWLFFFLLCAEVLLKHQTHAVVGIIEPEITDHLLIILQFQAHIAQRSSPHGSSLPGSSLTCQHTAKRNPWRGRNWEL